MLHVECQNDLRCILFCKCATTFAYTSDINNATVVISGCSPMWITHSDTAGQHGVTAPAATVDECRSQCIHNSSCWAIDWNIDASAARRCWLHGSWSTGRTARMPGVEHHVISGTCGSFLQNRLSLYILVVITFAF